LVKSLGLDSALNFKSPVKCSSPIIICCLTDERSERHFGRGSVARYRDPEKFTKMASFPAFWCFLAVVLQ
jgi:hypothetical protein